MKKTILKKTILLILSILILCVGAYAELTVTDVTVGSASQDRNEEASATFTVTNSGTESVSVTAVTTSAAAKYEVKFSEGASDLTLPFTLDAGASKTITVTAKVPEDFNAVNSELEETAFEIGKITVTGDESGTTVTASATLKMQAKNELRLRKGKATIKGIAGTSTDSFRDGGKVSDLKPGDSVELTVEVESTFPRSGSRETDFDDVELTLEIEDDSDFDFDEDEDDFSLRSGDEETARFSFKLEDDAADRSHTATVKARAVDENGAVHGAVLTFTLDVERDSHDLVLPEATLNPSRVICGAPRTVTFIGEVLNRGRLDEDEATVELRVDSLGILEKTGEFSIDEDDTEDVRLKFTVPEDVHGTFDVDVITNYDLTKTNNVRILTLTVDDCKKEEVKLPEPVPVPEESEPKPKPKPEEKKEEESTPVVQVPPGVVTQPGQAVAQGVPPARITQFRDSNTYLLLLGVASAVILVLIIALLSIAVKRR